MNSAVIDAGSWRSARQPEPLTAILIMINNRTWCAFWRGQQRCHVGLIQ